MQLQGTGVERHPASARFVRAEQAAHTEAARMVAALSKRDWETGTPAYGGATDAMALMLAAADDMAMAC